MAASLKIKRVVEQEVDVPGLGSVIKAAREQSPKTVKALASEAGISRQYWYQLEREDVLSAVSEETIRKVGEVLGVSFDLSFE